MGMKWTKKNEKKNSTSSEQAQKMKFHVNLVLYYILYVCNAYVGWNDEQCEQLGPTPFHPTAKSPFLHLSTCPSTWLVIRNLGPATKCPLIVRLLKENSISNNNNNMFLIEG